MERVDESRGRANVENYIKFFFPSAPVAAAFVVIIVVGVMGGDGAVRTVVIFTIRIGSILTRLSISTTRSHSLFHWLRSMRSVFSLEETIFLTKLSECLTAASTLRNDVFQVPKRIPYQMHECERVWTRDPLLDMCRFNEFIFYKYFIKI